MTYSDADVQRLVKAARDASDQVEGGRALMIQNYSWLQLKDALAPFQPEAELVERIHKNIMHSNTHSSGLSLAKVIMESIKAEGWTPPREEAQ